MKKLFVIIAALLVSLPAFAAEKENAFDRVMRTNTFRCGYGVWAPNIISDPNTNTISGIMYDYMEAIGKAASLKIEWREVAFTDFALELNAGRIDGMCAGIWPTASRAREMLFAAPVNYVTINAYIRASDKRFDNALEKLNSPDITLATMDVEMSSVIASADFPKAKTLSIPVTASQPQMLINVADGKADATFTDYATAAGYMKNNPGKLKLLPGGMTVRSFGNTVALSKNEPGLKAFLDTATAELLQSGVIEKILKKYEEHPGTLLRVAKPYEKAK